MKDNDKTDSFLEIEAKKRQLQTDPINAPILTDEDLREILLQNWVRVKTQNEINYGFKA